LLLGWHCAAEDDDVGDDDEQDNDEDDDEDDEAPYRSTSLTAARTILLTLYVS
jgi:hypothetical protein